MSFTLQPPLTIREARQQAEAFLDAQGIAEASLNVEWLLSRALGCPRLELHLRRDAGLAPEICRLLDARIKRLAAGEPLPYVLGEAEFMGRVFAVDPRALIPRPETEQLAELILGCADLWASAPPVIAEVGAGSGCLVISLALARPEGRYHALDIDAAALTLARENARRHGVEKRVRFAAGNLLAGRPPAGLDAVVSNPPYVRTADWAQLPAPIREHEPRQALDGGADGLAVIRPLIAQAARALKPGGRLFLEIGDGQGAPVRGLLEARGFRAIAIRPDLAGKTRFATARCATTGFP